MGCDGGSAGLSVVVRQTNGDNRPSDSASTSYHIWGVFLDTLYLERAVATAHYGIGNSNIF
jgi:hypothetical protein